MSRAAAYRSAMLVLAIAGLRRSNRIRNIRLIATSSARSASGPHRRSLLQERDSTLTGVGTAEHRRSRIIGARDRGIAVGRRLADELLRHLDRERAVRRDPLGVVDRGRDQLARLHDPVDQPQLIRAN